MRSSALPKFSFLLAGTLVFAAATGCAKPTGQAETESRGRNGSLPVTAQPVTCIATERGQFKLKDTFTYLGPVANLEALKTQLSGKILPFYDQWIPRVDERTVAGRLPLAALRNGRVSGTQFEARGIDSSTGSKFDVVVETKPMAATPESPVYLERMRIYHQNARQLIEISCPQPRLPSGTVNSRRNTLDVSTFVAECPNATRTIRFDLDMKNFPSSSQGTIESQLQYNRGSSWISTDGATLNPQGGVASIGNRVSNSSWTGNSVAFVSFPVRFPGDFRIAYILKDSSGKELARSETPALQVTKGSGCELRSTYLFFTMPPAESKIESTSNPSTTRGSLCPSSRPTTYLPPLNFLERRNCSSSSGETVSRQLTNFANDQGKYNACIAAYYDLYCR